MHQGERTHSVPFNHLLFIVSLEPVLHTARGVEFLSFERGKKETK